MIYRLLADLTLALHFAFILFVVFGGLLALRWRWIVWVHLPAAAWGALIAVVGWACPLTPIENRFRRLGGEAGYSESFIERYLVSIIYPGGLSRAGFVALGLLVVVLNLAVYSYVYHRRRRA